MSAHDPGFSQARCLATDRRNPARDETEPKRRATIFSKENWSIAIVSSLLTALSSGILYLSIAPESPTEILGVGLLAPASGVFLARILPWSLIFKAPVEAMARDITGGSPDERKEEGLAHDCRTELAIISLELEKIPGGQAKAIREDVERLARKFDSYASARSLK